MSKKDCGSEVPCYVCLLPLSGAAYICAAQCKFILHKASAELTNKIIHILHPRHPLTLLADSPYQGSSPICDNCGQQIWGFIYHCSIYRFDVDIKCASLQPIVEHEGHKHSFMLHRPTPFKCNACSETSNGMSFICSICQLWIHKNCASLPPTIKHIGHDHTLNLIHSIQVNDPVANLCKVCGEEIDTCYWGYHCASCTYITHLHCARSETLPGDEGNEPGPAFMSMPNESTTGLLISNDVNKISLTKIERVRELQHFSHQHSLTLSDDEPESEQICDGCMVSISPPFYKCAKCLFFLHISCAELPKITRIHPLHPHPLSFLAKANSMDGVFHCHACQQWANGFVYNCESCDIFIDVRCNSLSETIKHKGHEHTLNLVQKESASECNACGHICRTKFRCEGCDFNLDLGCATLPYEVRHKWDIHPLKLTFVMEDESGEYYCDICEERRAPNRWFYRCENCNLFAHPKCIPKIGKNI